ncbi:Uncharacterised protein [Salmonella enterica subsp. indica]|uniref:Uncharacterized protein n=2 Tax=Salmonella enterica subsp. indica TaxID=59207 RepID=A0A379XK58_SALER|nr:hypothetical protein SEI61121_07994 [Salmonella enterica subsp. indica serovar 6,14,25:z10:1,(2),7 str. 1121]SUI00625.1 Uncharacterised protein [Salmonella enterica subsp. indica]
MVLNRTLSMKKIPGFSNVVNTVNKFASEGLVTIEIMGINSCLATMSLHRDTDKKREF